MKRIKEVGFLLVGAVYYLSLIVFVTALVIRSSGSEDPAVINIGGLAMLLNATSILIWGFVAGTMTYRRGWQMAGTESWKTTQWFSLVLVEGLFAAGAIVMHGVEYKKNGEFFPAPNKC